MADERDLNNDGQIDFVDEEMAEVMAIKEAREALKRELVAEGTQDRSVPEEGSTGLQQDTTFVRRRSNEKVDVAKPEEAEPTAAFGVDLSTLDRAAENTNDRFNEALGEDLLLEQRRRQSTDSQN